MVNSRFGGLVYEFLIMSCTYLLYVFLCEIFDAFVLDFKAFQPRELLVAIKTQAEPKVRLRLVIIIVRKLASNSGGVYE